MFAKFKAALGRLFSSAGYPETGAVFGDRPGAGLSAYMDGGYYYGSGGDGSGWPYGLTIGSSPTLDHSALRQNARIAYHDSMPARAIVERFADIVPGVGLRFEPSPRAQALGISPEQGDEWAQKVGEAFDAYMSSKTFSILEDETGYQSQRLVSIMQQRDGEYFARLHYSASRKLLNPLQISFIDPSQIQGTAYTRTDGQQVFTTGINYDSVGREVSYDIATFDESDGRTKVVRIPKYGARSGRLMLAHGYQKEYPGQRRGYSRLAHALQSFKNFTDFEYAHVRKAINDAAIAMYIKPPPDRPAVNPMADMVGGAAGPLQAPEAPPSTTDSGDLINYSELNTVNLRPDSIGLFNLQGGEDLKEFKGSTPADNYDTFTASFVKSLSASMSMPIEALWMQFGQNYSASRATLVMLWQAVEIWRAEMVADYLEPILENWLAGEIAAGRIQAPGWSDPRLRRAWLSGHWIGFPMPSIDPYKEAMAKKEWVNLGATTLDRVAQQYDGSSGKANRAKQHREFEELAPSPYNSNVSQEENTDSEDASNRGQGPGRPPGS